MQNVGWYAVTAQRDVDGELVQYVPRVTIGHSGSKSLLLGDLLPFTAPAAGDYRLDLDEGDLCLIELTIHSLGGRHERPGGLLGGAGDRGRVDGPGRVDLPERR